MTSSSATLLRREDTVANLVYTAVAMFAAVPTAIAAAFDPRVLALLVVALVPWALALAGRELPAWVVVLAGVLPVAGIETLLGFGVVVFMATAALSRAASRGGGAALVAGASVLGVALPFVPFAAGRAFDIGSVYFAFGNLLGIGVGLLLLRSRRLVVALHTADARLAAAMAAAERARLARDVHDLVAHSLTVVVLHIGGARRILRTDPATAAAALEQAEQICRESLDGIRGVVGLLRDEDEPPVAALDLNRLADTYTAAGVPVELTIDGDPSALPLLPRGTAHRVVQEALANAARYRAADATVYVEVRVTEEGARLRIVNVRGPASASGRPGGFGLTGLREQVGTIRGVLTSGPIGADWVVECQIPWSAPSPDPGTL
jgi:signal transduction histidine kinase